MLEDTLVIWGAEFGRTPFGQGDSNKPNGRDHFGRAFSWLMAGGGVKKRHVHGSTDEFGWNITENPVHVHDMQATIMHLCGIDHTRLTYRYQGRANTADRRPRRSRQRHSGLAIHSRLSLSSNESITTRRVRF